MTLEDIVEIAYPQQPHCPTILLLDVSGSMVIGDKISQLNEGIRIFKEEIEQDELARKRVDVSVITFGSKVEVAHDFSSVEDFNPPELIADGLTPMGDAIKKTLDILEKRKNEYKKEGIDYYRPWIFLITDGEPTDMSEGDDKWNEIVSEIHKGEDEGRFLFFAVGVDSADMETLKKISPPARTPIKLKENHFKEMFLWLSKSQTKVSASTMGEQVILDDPFGTNGWGEIPSI
ncbi:VWA domain-containing protein [Methanomicrobium antiquum]|uniref:VWA domain-containing protein n=1 Tax=Methanomicrobium antiquum TaxID=487686 RepID=A0AAF0FS62_9EURY|nr:VWA domain-containing protein [Methanomicrobium antiquum]MDD3976569.1 VWA domain-containing protein [Methanomicrobium sp.]WFN37514.1 VWA domain-containing protein [Methanomicrobium antiquum]